MNTFTGKLRRSGFGRCICGFACTVDADLAGGSLGLDDPRRFRTVPFLFQRKLTEKTMVGGRASLD